MGQWWVSSLAATVVPLALVAATLLSHVGPAAGQPAALVSPVGKRCLFMAYRGENPKLASNPLATTVENAEQLFDIETVADGFAVCRRALAAFPSEPKLIIANHNATGMLLVTLFGFAKFPKTDADAVAKARVMVEGNSSSDRFVTPLVGVLLGTAYEYGIGAAKDPGEALKWYRLAADAGSEVGKREFERISAAGKERTAPDGDSDADGQKR
jgi:hypothetical protein